MYSFAGQNRSVLWRLDSLFNLLLQRFPLLQQVLFLFWDILNCLCPRHPFQALFRGRNLSSEFLNQ